MSYKGAQTSSVAVLGPAGKRKTSHHHEVELAVGAAHGFKFERDATELRPRLAGHGGGESGQAGRREKELFPEEKHSGKRRTFGGMNSLETRDVDVEDEVVVVGASRSTLDVITCHLPACHQTIFKIKYPD